MTRSRALLVLGLAVAAPIAAGVLLVPWGTVPGPTNVPRAVPDARSGGPVARGTAPLTLAAREGASTPERPAPPPIVDDERVVRSPILETRTIHGVVRDRRGDVVAGAAVTLRDRYDANVVVSTTTGRDGSFSVDGVPAGTRSRIYLEAVAQGHTPAVVSLETEQISVDVSLREYTSALLEVRDAEGRPVSGCAVTTSPTGPDGPVAGPAPRDRTDADGLASLRGLDRDLRYRLHVEPPGDRGDVLPLEIGGWEPADSVLRLPAAYAIEGTVVDLAGTPVASAAIWAKADGGDWKRDAVRDGRFRVLRLDPTAYDLQARPMDAATFDTSLPLVRARAGDRDVRLVLDPGASLELRFDDAGRESGRSVVLLAEHTRGAEQRAVVPDGRVRFAGLAREGTYTAWAPPWWNGRRVARRAGISPSDGPIRVQWEESLAVTGRIIVPKGAIGVHVDAALTEQLVVPGRTVDATGEYVIDGLPVGHLVVRASAWLESVRWSAAARVPAGTTVDLRLVEETPADANR